MHRRSIAPFCRDDGPQTDPTIRLPATWRHSGLTKVSITESHGEARKESLKFIPSHSAAPRCVHAVARKRGPRGGKSRSPSEWLLVPAWGGTNVDSPKEEQRMMKLTGLAGAGLLVAAIAFLGADGSIPPGYAHDAHGAHPMNRTFSAGEPGNPKQSARLIEITMHERDG